MLLTNYRTAWIVIQMVGRITTPATIALQNDLTVRLKSWQRGSMAAKKRGVDPGIEWVGGIAQMPAVVDGEGPPFRPEILMWIGAEGAILGSLIARPGQLLPQAAQNLRETIASPAYGTPHSPSKVRVASPELAKILRQAFGSEIEVICAPTLEFDLIMTAMLEYTGQTTPQSYLSSGVNADAMERLFRAAARLYRSKPWLVVPFAEDPISITIPAFGIKNAAISVIGQMNQDFGFLLFASVEVFDAFILAGHGIEAGQQPSLPPFLSLNFERGADIADSLRKEVAKYQWEVATAEAYLELVAHEANNICRLINLEDVLIAEATSLALSALVMNEELVNLAWGEGKNFECTITVEAGGQKVDVILKPFFDRDPPKLIKPKKPRAKKPAKTRH